MQHPHLCEHKWKMTGKIFAKQCAECGAVGHEWMDVERARAQKALDDLKRGVLVALASLGADPVAAARETRRQTEAAVAEGDRLRIENARLRTEIELLKSELQRAAR